MREAAGKGAWRKAGRLFLLLCSSVALIHADPTSARLRQSIIETALGYRGVPYVYGAESPEAFDCSGFVRYVYDKAAGIDLPRSSREQFDVGVPVDGSAKPGDILVFDTVGGGPSHVGIFLGKGTMIHAASEGPATGVIVSSLRDRYYVKRLLGARNFLDDAVSIQPPRKAARPKAGLPRGHLSPMTRALDFQPSKVDTSPSLVKVPGS
jgi:hypothetical protein